MALQSAGFIGLGNMGHPMAANLIKNGIKLYVFNRSKEKAQDLLDKGAVLLDSPNQMFLNTDVVFSMVADDEALGAISNGLLENVKPNSIHVSMSTVSPQIIRELHVLHKEKGCGFLSAPVFGRPNVAAQQNLWICLSGEPKAKETVIPLLRFMGQKVYDFGEKIENANVVKISGNFFILSIVEALSEMFAFAEKHGVDLSAFNSFLGDSLFPSPVIQTYGKLIASQQFEPAGFKMELGSKDINLILKAADSSKVPMPLAGLLHDKLLEGLANNRGEMDWSAISISAFEAAGLSLKEPIGK